MRARFSLALAAAVIAGPASAADGDWAAVAQAFGKPGVEQAGGVYRIAVPRTDLQVTLDGVTIRPALALGSYLVFQKSKGNTGMVMGDLVLLHEEVNPVMK